MCVCAMQAWHRQHRVVRLAWWWLFRVGAWSRRAARTWDRRRRQLLHPRPRVLLRNARRTARLLADSDCLFFSLLRRYHSALGFAGMTVDEAHGVSMMQQGIAGTLVFATTRHQASALRLELNADTFTLSSSVASGTIVSNVVAAFPANALSTTVAVTCVALPHCLVLSICLLFLDGRTCGATGAAYGRNVCAD